MLKLGLLRGGTISELETKKYTIGVGISLGNKWFTPENIVEAIKWALEFSKDKVVVYIADSIHGINLSVRNRMTLEKATKRSVEAGAELFEKVKEILTGLSPEQLKRIIFVKWDEIVDERFKEKLAYLESLYENDKNFKETIHSLVRGHTSKESRAFSEEDIHRFGKYIIAEMPEFLGRVPMKEIVVDAYTYPTDNTLTKFAEQIQKGEVFPEIRDKVLDTEPKVFIELR